MAFKDILNLFGRTSLNKSVLDGQATSTDGTNPTDCAQGSTSQAKELTVRETYGYVAPIQNGISKIAKAAAKAEIRHFDRNGNEIIDGSLYRLTNKPNKYCSENEMKIAAMSWYLLTGEFGILQVNQSYGPSGLFQRPGGLLVLDPTNLTVYNPTEAQCRDIHDVNEWEYRYRNGVQIRFSPENLIYGKTFSAGKLRGLSPVMSGKNEIASYFNAWAYASRFFDKDATPNIMVTLPANYGKDSLKQYKEMWQSTFGGVGNVKVFFSTGESKVEKLDNGLKDALADKMIQMSEATIYKIYSVPPMISGDWQNAKYDSATEQLETFAENTIFPLLQCFTDAFQSQLTDRYDWSNDIKVSKSYKPLSKAMKKELEKALDTYSSAKIVTIFDTDTLPIMAKLKEAKINNAKVLVDGFRLSPKEASEYYGLDLPENEYSDLVFVPSSVKDIRTVLQPEIPATPPPGTQDAPPVQDEPATEEVANKALVSKISKAFLYVRKNATDAVMNNRPFKLRDFDNLIKEVFPNEPLLHKEVRLVYNRLNSLLKKCSNSMERQAAVKIVFNEIPRAKYKEIAIQIEKKETNNE